jgi:steroid delta-isomerase-like uncharacterized protein
MSESSEVIHATNIFTLKDTGNIDRLVDLIQSGVNTTSSRNPGYQGDTILRSVDGKTVLNLSSWKGGVQQLMQNHQANETNPRYGEQMAEIAKIADFAPSAYTDVWSHNGGAKLARPEITGADVQRWLDAWNSHDIDKIVALFTDDVMMHQPQNPQPLTKDGLAGFFSMLFKSYADIRFDLQGHTIEGREVASWERVTGTMTGAFTDPATGNIIEPTHKSFDILGAMHLSYGDGGLIREVRIYWDRLLMMTQVGLLGSQA